MNHSISMLALLATFTLAACDRPTVVTTPSNPVVVPVPSTPGPAGPAGPAGKPGDPGKPGDSSTVIVVPPAASAPK